MNAAQNSGGGGGRSRNKKRKKSNNRKKSFDAEAFWGDMDALPTPEGFETETPDPVAVISSLGQPPLPGHGAAALHYFRLVYDRATNLGAALAMAGGIDDLSPELVEDDADHEMTSDEEE